MGLKITFNKKARTVNDTGLATNSNYNGGRFFNKDGTANLNVRGLFFLERLNLYHWLVNIPRWKFFIIIFLFFIVINLFFAGAYLLIGLDHLGGMVANSPSEKFGEAFFFSAQTFTTVGYGRINPIGFWASVTAAFEALCGLLSFALATGLLYGRFAKPRAYIKFSQRALFSPYKDGIGFMLRMVPYTNNYLVNVEVKVTLAMRIDEDGATKNKFYALELEIARANTLNVNWTLVHPINEESPLYKLTKKDIEAAQTEVLVFVQGFDESFSNTVVTRTSYTFEEFVYGAKFLPMFNPTPDGKSTILHLDKLDDYEPKELPFVY